MYTRSTLMSFLKEISEGAHFESFNYDSPEQFSVILKCKVEDGCAIEFYNDFAKNWINKFSIFTSTAWIVKANHPTVKRIAFRKSYWCHRSSHNKSKTIQNARNMFCHAKVDFKTKFINKYTVRNDEGLLRGLNMTITIHFEHSHVVHDVASFNLLKSSTETDAIFYEYFEDGHNATSAKCYHELGLIEEYGRDSLELTNATLNPSPRHIAYIYSRRKQTALDDDAVMQKKTMALEKFGHTVKYTQCPRFVVVLTAIMKRVIKLMPVDNVLIDDIVMSSGVSVMFLYVPTDIGSLPIASVVYKEQSDTYSDMFSALKLTIESETNKSFHPKFVLLGNLKAKDAVLGMFPEAVVKKNRLAVCREYWQYISGRNSGIANRMTQHETMVKVKSLIYASPADAARIYETFLGNANLEPCLGKVGEIWAQRDDWMMEDPCDFDNAFPVIIRECVTRRCQTFNICAMVDVVAHILEKQYKRIILCSVMGGDVKAAYTKLLPKAEIVASSFRRLNASEFLMQGAGIARYYQLNLDAVCCDCKVGETGAFCEHLCAAVNYVHNEFIQPFYVSEGDKSMFSKIVEEEDAVMEGDDEQDFVGCTEEHADESVVADFSIDVKHEVIDPLEEAPIASTSQTPMTVQYEAAMKALNDEFRRLNKLFKENPNFYNMETMKSLASELTKIKPVAMVNFSDLKIRLNNTE